MIKSRRAMLATLTAASAAAAALRFPVNAAQFSYKLSLDRPPSDANVVYANQAVTKIMNDSGGQFEIKVFPSGSLGGDPQVLAQVRVGAIEFTVQADVITSNIVPNASIDAVGFAFPDYKSVWNAMDGKLGAYVRDQIRQQGMYAFETIWDGGFKGISNSIRPIAKPDDLKGMKIRATPGAISVSLYKTLGAQPVAIDSNQIYTAEQTHLVDGADVSADLVLTQNFYEVQKYMTLTNHSFVVFHFLAGAEPWQRLPKKLQEITESNFNASAKALRGEGVKNLQTTLATLKTKGVEISQCDVKPFRDALRSGGYYSYWKEKFGPEAWGVLESTAGKLS